MVGCENSDGKENRLWALSTEWDGNVNGNDMLPLLPFTYLTHSEYCRIFAASKRFISLPSKKVHKKKIENTNPFVIAIDGIWKVSTECH